MPIQSQQICTSLLCPGASWSTTITFPPFCPHSCFHTQLLVHLQVFFVHPVTPRSPSLRCLAWSTPSFQCYLANSYSSLNAQLHRYLQGSTISTKAVPPLASWWVQPLYDWPYMLSSGPRRKTERGRGEGKSMGEMGKEGERIIPTQDPADH